MKNGQHHYAARLVKIEDGVWKATNLNAPDCAVFGGIPPGVYGSELGGMFDFRCKLNAEAGLPLFVPNCSLVEFISRRATKDNAQGHLFSRAVMEE